MLTLLSIPSPSQGVWYLGPVPVRGYALAIILGIVAAIWISEKRWQNRGGRAGEIQDLAIWAVPFGLVGGRLYHVATDHERYFGAGGDPWKVLYVWEGGLGVWGAIALGALGVFIGARRKGIKIWPVLDVMAPGVIVAQALGRWGNWFNQELYGRPTDLPWGLEIDPEHYPSGRTFADGTTFHPTFLYEFVWNLGIFGLLIWADRRWKLGHGRMVALYVMGYTLGRGWIEMLRIDTVELNDVGGLRFNVWTSIVMFLVALGWFLYSRTRWPEREPSVYDAGRGPEHDAPVAADAATIPEDEPETSPDRSADGPPGAV
jgi:prolipoprotein diacylglyceryl transferase